MRWYQYIMPVLSVVLCAGCGLNPIDYEPYMLDAPGVNDTSFVDLSFKISTHPRLDTIDRHKPVIICVHGYGACTFEWEEFRDYALADNRVTTSLVLLGGHGRDIDDLRNCSWKDWQAPIMKEFDTLVALGFTNITLAGSSTGGALLIEYLSSQAFTSKTILPKACVFIDPIIVSSDKTLSLVGSVGPILGNVYLEDTTPLEQAHWYHNRPVESLEQLNNLIELIRDRLEHGFVLPPAMSAKLFQSKGDGTADPVGALLAYKGLRTNNGGHIDVEMVDSKLHVFTRLRGRSVATAADTVLQLRVFKEIIDISTR